MLEVRINGKPTGLCLEGITFDDVLSIDTFLAGSEEFIEALAGRKIKCITYHPDGWVDCKVTKAPSKENGPPLGSMGNLMLWWL